MDSPTSFRRTISVSGTGTTTLAPDIAYFSAEVAHMTMRVAEAKQYVNATMQAILAALEENRVDRPRDVQTSGYTVQPQHSYPKNRAPLFEGYNVRNSIRVTVRDIAAAGEILEAVTEAGATTISNLSFGLSDPTAAHRTARERAVRDAREKAETLARESGIAVGVALTINEGIGDDDAVFSQYSHMGVAYSSAADQPPPIEAGEISTSVTVRIVYAIA